MERSAKLSLYDLLQQFKTEINRDLRVCVPGKIVSVNLENATVNVSILVTQRIYQTNLPLGVVQPYPILENCPIFSIQGGKVGAIMPVSAGDECLIVFSDRCIDGWFETGEATPLPSIRMHDISDGFVFVGMNSMTNPLNTPLDAGEGGICVTNNGFGAKVAINPITDLITMQNATQSLLLVLTSLITSLATLNTAIAGESDTIPIAAGTALTNEAAIILVQTALNSLLY